MKKKGKKYSEPSIRRALATVANKLPVVKKVKVLHVEEEDGTHIINGVEACIDAADTLMNRLENFRVREKGQEPDLKDGVVYVIPLDALVEALKFSWMYESAVEWMHQYVHDVAKKFGNRSTFCAVLGWFVSMSPGGLGDYELEALVRVWAYLSMNKDVAEWMRAR